MLINCTYTNKVIKRWKIEKVDPADGTVESEITLDSLLLGYNELTVPKIFMCFGTHKVSFEAEMDPVDLEAKQPGIGKVATTVMLINTF